MPATRTKTPPKSRRPRTTKAETNPTQQPTQQPTELPPTELPPGIRDLVWVRASDLQKSKNPLNWRVHPPHQSEATAASIKRNGWAGALLYNTTTNRLIDGHDRLSVALSNKLASDLVPVLRGAFTPEQERHLLSVYDPISAMAETDHRALSNLLAQVKDDTAKLADLVSEQDLAPLASLHTSLEDEVESIRQGAQPSFFPASHSNTSFASDVYVRPSKRKAQLSDPNQSEGVDLTQPPHDAREATSIPNTPFTLKDPHEIDTLKDFQPLAAYDIPRILPEHLADPPPTPMLTWIGPEHTPPAHSYFLVYSFRPIPEEHAAKTIVGFYTFDAKLEPLWDDPVPLTVKVLTLKPYALLTPNFSIYERDPLAVRIFQTFRAYWTGRYWGEYGIKIIPDALLPRNEDDLQWRYTPIPQNAPCIAIQFQTRVKEQEAEYFNRQKYLLKKLIDLLKPQSLLAYCPDNLPPNFFNQMPKQLLVIKTLTWMSARRALVPSLQLKPTGQGQALSKEKEKGSKEKGTKEKGAKDKKPVGPARGYRLPEEAESHESDSS